MQSNTRDTHAQKIILITGASCGSGAATARLLAQQGAHLGNRDFKRSFAASRGGFREAAAGIAPGRGKLGLGKALGEKWKVTGH